MNIKTAAKSTRILYYGLTATVWLLFGYALYMSTMHVVDSALKLGLTGMAAYTSPLLVDVFAIVGKVGMLPRWNAEARKAARGLLATGLILSLGSNIYAGHNMGERGQGVVIVLALWLLERFMGKLMGGVAETVKPAGKTCEPGCECGKHSRTITKAIVVTRKCAPGCACGKHNRAKVTAAP